MSPRLGTTVLEDVNSYHINAKRAANAATHGCVDTSAAVVNIDLERNK